MHVFFWREAIRSIRQHHGLALTAILSITGALLLCGMFLLLTYNAEVAMRLIGDRREMVIYLRDGVTASQRDLLAGRLHDLYGEVVYVSKQQAWDEFSQSVGEVDRAKLNVMGGSIAIGHPFGATGARITTTLLNELRRRGGQFGLMTVCAAGGMGFAMVVERTR